MRKISLSCAGLILALLLCFPANDMLPGKPYQQGSKPRKQIEITAANAAIRKYPSESYKSLGTAKRGDTFLCYGLTKSGWYQIKYNNQLAYVKKANARMIKTEASPAKPAVSKESAGAPTRAEKAPPPETSSLPIKASRNIPWVWILIALFLVAMYVLYFLRNIKAQREFENHLRHKPG